MRWWSRPWLAPVVVLALLASGCGLFDSEEPEPELLAELAAAGIAVYAEPGDPEPLVAPAEPASPVRLLEWQARLLAREADGGGGVSVAELDAAVGVETLADGQVTVAASQVVLGWAGEHDSPAAGHARQLLGDRLADPPLVPQLVLLLFASDVATAGASLPELPMRSAPWHGPAPERDAPRTGLVMASIGVPGGAVAGAAATGPCSAVLDFVHNTVGAVFDAISKLVEPPRINTGFALFDEIANTVVGAVFAGAQFVIEAGRIVIEGGLNVLIGDAMAVIARIAGIAGTVAKLIGMIRPWTLEWTLEPAVNTRVAGPHEGSLTASIDLGGLDEWPDWLADCAQRAGAPLPQLKPVGNPVQWSGFGQHPAGLITAGEHDPTLDQHSAATARYHTVPEPDYGEDATEHEGQVSIVAKVQRDDASELQRAIMRLVQNALSQLAGPFGRVISPLVMPLINDITQRATDAVADLMRTVSGAGYVTVIYHEPGEDEEPANGERPPGQAAALDCVVGTWRSESVDAFDEAFRALGGGGDIRLTIGPAGDATVVYDLADGNRVAPQFVAGTANLRFSFTPTTDTTGHATVLSSDHSGVDVSEFWAMAGTVQIYEAWWLAVTEYHCNSDSSRLSFTHAGWLEREQAHWTRVGG